MDILVLGILLFIAYPIIVHLLGSIGTKQRVDQLGVRFHETNEQVVRLEDQMRALRNLLTTYTAPTPSDLNAPAATVPDPVAATDLAAPAPDGPPPFVAPEEQAAPAHVEAPVHVSEPAYESQPEPQLQVGMRQDLKPPAWLIAAKEWLFTGNVVAKIGLLILLVGISFLLKYVGQRTTVPIELRLCAIVVANLALLAWAWRIRLARRDLSLPIQGATQAILMLVTFGAFHQYKLIPAGAAFALLVLFTVATCALAVLQDAIWLAIFGICGGFAAPILASDGTGNYIALFSYYAVLNTGILAIAIKRAWRSLNVLGFALTFSIGGVWGYLSYAPEQYWPVQGFLLLFFVYYVGIAVAFAARQQAAAARYVDATLVLGTPLVAFGMQAALVKNMPFGLAWSALTLALFYTGLALLLWRRRGQQFAMLTEVFLSVGVVFGSLTLPLALDERWTSAAWAFEGAGMVWIGLRQRQIKTWVFGLLVQAGAAFPLLRTFDSQQGLNPILIWPDSASNLFDTPILSVLMIAAGALLSSWSFHRYRSPADSLRLDRILLGWAGYWYFGTALYTLADWLSLYSGIPVDSFTGSEWPFYGLCVAASATAAAIAARRLAWPLLRWLSVPCWALLLLATLDLLGRLYISEALPALTRWLAYAALWLGSEYLLRLWPAQAWPMRVEALRLIHTVRSAGPWLFVWPAMFIPIFSWLAGLDAERAYFDVGSWQSRRSWSYFTPSLVMLLTLSWFIARARTDRWPTTPIGAWYRRALIPALTAFSLLVTVVLNLQQNGEAAPLPYLPLLNPLDLSTALALLTAAICMRMLHAEADQFPPAVSRMLARLPLMLALLGYGWFNLVLLRSAAHYLRIDYRFDELFDSQFVEAMLSILWSITALLLMRRAAIGSQRHYWLAGAGLLALVAAKLFLVDLHDVGGMARIVSFVGVGLLMVLIGYVAPYPSQAQPQPQPQPARA